MINRPTSVLIPRRERECLHKIAQAELNCDLSTLVRTLLRHWLLGNIILEKDDLVLGRSTVTPLAVDDVL
jgi:hypothetical protein